MHSLRILNSGTSFLAPVVSERFAGELAVAGREEAFE